MTDDRYSRQIRLPEIGESGQARIHAARARVSGLDGADIEIRYLLGAGVGAIEHEPDESPLPFPHATCFRFTPACRVAAGAWRALQTLKHALAERP